MELIKVCFMGSAGLSRCMFDAILADQRCEVVGVVTQPDRPRGRGRHSEPCEVKARAMACGLPVLTPESVNDPAVLPELEGFGADVMAVVAYGQFIGKRVRTMTRLGCINLHLSLLPKYRGAAPVQWAIANGEPETGVTSMRIDAGMDTGDILLRERVQIGSEETAGELFERLAPLGAALLVRTLHGLVDDTIRETPQNDEAATHAPKIKKQDGRIDWTCAAQTICHRVRGFAPWPSCYCCLPDAPRVRRKQGCMMKIHEAVAVPGTGKPGEVICCGEEGLKIAAGEGAVCVRRLQLAGKRAMSVGDFVHGHTLKIGDMLD